MMKTAPCFKVLMAGCGTFLAIVGILLSAVGGVVQFQTEMIGGYLTPLTEALPSGSGIEGDLWTLYSYSSLALIGLGISASLIGIHGCLTSMCITKTSLIINMVVLTMLIFSKSAGVAILMTADLGKDLLDTLNSNLQNNYVSDTATSGVSQSWNYVFIEFSCCGVETYTEFLSAIRWERFSTPTTANDSVATVPLTCCKLPDPYPNFGQPKYPNCTEWPTATNANVEKGCYDDIYEYFWYYGILMSCAFGAGVIFEAICLMLDICISKTVKSKNVRVKPTPEE